MNRRIKLIWVLCLLTMLFIFIAQGYWLYEQYRYTYKQEVQKMETSCGKLMQAYENMRYKTYIDKIFYTINEKTTLVNGVVSQTQYIYHLPNGQIRIIRNIDPKYSTEAYSRYLSSMAHPKDQQVIDSLLLKKGYGSSEKFRHIQAKTIYMEPQYEDKGLLHRRIHVIYSNNPIEKQAIEFLLCVPISNIIKSMIWQLLACLLLFCVLVFCIIFQLKTILLQKQIDRIRHEFMKNMIYEMKQPQPSDIEGIMQRIGHTEFYYSLNELRFENQRIIITSRQAEILRILSENQCKSISREYILKEVWGDDSFSNSKALNVQISYLRRALISDHTISIEPIIRKGYMLKIDK
jgi:hypothetical protein